MKDSIIEEAARRFADQWKGRGYEKGETQMFWTTLLRDVLGVARPEEIIRFEDQVKLGRTGFIDAYISPTHVLVEQKGIDKDLRKPVRQSDGSMLTPFQQAKRYSAELPYDQRPRWIVACNFRSFLVHDMDNPSGEPEEILLEDLPREHYRLRFLVDAADRHVHKEVETSLQAGDIVGRVYEALLARYLHPEREETLRSLNILCVRLVFCLYAEDAGVFGRHGLFHDYLSQFPPERMRGALRELFAVLDTPPERRDPYMEDGLLAAFPYVNGGLFAEAGVEIPSLDAGIAHLLLSRASDGFDWSRISPTIFGAVFESTLNPATRRAGGMHYTSVENIHRVIDPLFASALRGELDEIGRIKSPARRRQAAEAFRSRLASLRRIGLGYEATSPCAAWRTSACAWCMPTARCSWAGSSAPSRCPSASSTASRSTTLRWRWRGRPFGLPNCKWREKQKPLWGATWTASRSSRIPTSWRATPCAPDGMRSARAGRWTT